MNFDETRRAMALVELRERLASFLADHDSQPDHWLVVGPLELRYSAVRSAVQARLEKTDKDLAELGVAASA